MKIGDKIYRIRLTEDCGWVVVHSLTIGQVETRDGREVVMCHETGVGTGSVYYTDEHFPSQEAAEAECKRRNAIMANGQPKPTIFCFVNGGSDRWYDVIAVAEDGECLAGHICSHPTYGPHDMGVTSDWKHEQYWKHYPEGFQLEWVEDVKSHERLSKLIAEANAKE